MNPRAESFMRGALVLTLAGVISRVMGAAFKPIVTRIFALYDGYGGEAGIGLTSPPASLYMVLLSVSSVGINIAISRMVAERVTRGDYRGAWRVFTVALWLMGGLGLSLSVAMFLAAPHLAAVWGRPEVASGFVAVAPAIFLISIMSAYRGFFQGLQQMTPYAISQVWEQLVRVSVAIALVWLWAPISVPMGAAGFNLGSAAGGLAGLGYLLLIYWRQRQWFLTSLQQGQAGESVGSILGQVLRLAAPLAFIGAILPLLQLADTYLILRQLAPLAVVGDAADSAVGRVVNALAIINLPPILTTSLYVSLVPAITEAVVRGNMALARHRAVIAYRMTAIFAIPSAVGVYVLADEVYWLLYSVAGAGPVVAGLALAMFFLMVQQTSSGLLQGLGKVALTARNLFIGLVVKVAATYYLVGLPALQEVGAAHGYTLGFAVAAGLNVWAVRRHLGPVIDLVGMFVKPGVAAGLMGGAIWLLHPLMLSLLGRPVITTLLLIALGALIYGAVLLLIGGVQARDIEMMPRIGPKLAASLKDRGLLRDK